jgi:M6 family metalloprotease-like protein
MRSVVVSASLFAFAGVSCAQDPPGAAVGMNGTLHVAWVETEQGEERQFLVRSPSGRELLLDLGGLPDGVEHARDLLERHRERDVSLSFTGPEDWPLRVTALEADDPPVARQTLQSPLTGPRPYVVVLCRFADDPSTPAEPNYYRTLYQDTYPGISHYWREVSYGSLSMAASVVLGWYNLAKTRSQYLSNGMIQFAVLAQDCAARAQNDVQFPNYRGISVVMNGLVVTSGTESLSLTLNGTTRSYGVSEFNAGSSQNPGDHIHEIGHTFGLGHSSRYPSCGDDYANGFDPMGHQNFSNCDPFLGCFPGHLSAYHKGLLGWIPSGKRAVFSSPANGTVPLDRLGQPFTVGRPWMAQVPIPDSSDYYTLEVRRRVTQYEADLPSEGLVVHRISPGESLQSRVVARDGTCSGPDELLTLNAGDRYDDHVSGVRISVDSEDSIGANARVATLPTQTLSVTPQGPGRISVNPGALIGINGASSLYSVMQGTSVTLTARPDQGAVFSGWSGCPSPAGATCTAVADTSRSISARFTGTCPLDDECMSDCMAQCIADGMTISRCRTRCTTRCTMCL